MESEVQQPAASRSRTAAFRLLALAFAVVFAAGFGEAALRLLGYGRSYFHPFSMFYEVDDLVGIRGRPNFTGRLKNDEMDVVISNDARGFRKPARASDASPERPNVFVLGDSFIWGWGVGQGQVVTDLIQERLRDRRVQNFAVSATGTAQQFVIFEKYVLPTLRQGDWVVLGFCGVNDFADNLGRNLQGRLHAKLVDGQVQLVPADGTASITPFEQQLRDSSYLLNLLIYSWNRGAAACRQAWHPSVNALTLASASSHDGGPRANAEKEAAIERLPDQAPYGDDTPEYVVTAHFLRALKTACQERGARFVVVYIPRQEEFGELVEYKGAPFSTRERQTLLRCTQSLGIDVLDLLPRFRAWKAAAPEARLSYREGHWNPAGHRVACDSLCEFLTPRVAAR
jgi:lysophospholipase L1-like esterase